MYSAQYTSTVLAGLASAGGSSLSDWRGTAGAGAESEPRVASSAMAECGVCPQPSLGPGGVAVLLPPRPRANVRDPSVRKKSELEDVSSKKSGNVLHFGFFATVVKFQASSNLLCAGCADLQTNS